MKYRDIIGFSTKKQKFVKKAENKIAPKPTVPPVTELLKKEFGQLNEWTSKPPTEKRWSKNYNGDKGLTEFEQRGGKDNVNEGPAYEYDKYVSAIEKNEKNYWKSVTNFADVLHNKGLEKESKVIERAYIKNVKMGFSKLLEKVVRKLM